MTDNYCFPGIGDSRQWCIPTILSRQASHQPDRVVIEFTSGERWTFAQCLKEALITAESLRQSGAQIGDTIAVMTDDPVVFCRYWFGLSMLGATMVAINTAMRGSTLQHQLETARVSMVLTDSAMASRIDDLGNAAPPCVRFESIADNTAVLSAGDQHTPAHSDIACIMFTSGTSGPSKGVLMPHAHCVLFAIGTWQNMDLRSDDRFYICLPLFHANGLFMQLLACLLTGARAVIRPRFSTSEWLNDIRRYQITHTNTLGAVASFITNSPATDSDRDHCLRVVGAAPLPGNADSIFRDRFGVPSVIPMYGMTEVNIPLYGRLHEQAPDTCGVEYSAHFEVQIRDADSDEPVTDGVIGELMVRPKTPFGFAAGYAGIPEKTNQAMRNFWFHTGDAAWRRDDGYFVFVDRIKDCIRRRGENISSYEVEQAFLTLDEVLEAAAFAVPADGGDGMEDEVMIALVLQQPATDAKLLASLRERAAPNLASFAVPRYVRAMPALPCTPTGKVRKAELRLAGVTDDTLDAATTR
jgi:crotonobetaine/carnitine-CoA ligase